MGLFQLLALSVQHKPAWKPPWSISKYASNLDSLWPISRYYYLNWTLFFMTGQTYFCLFISLAKLAMLWKKHTSFICLSFPKITQGYLNLSSGWIPSFWLIYARPQGEIYRRNWKYPDCAIGLCVPRLASLTLRIEQFALRRFCCWFNEIIKSNCDWFSGRWVTGI